MRSFPPSIFGSRILALFAATFVIHVLASIDLGLIFILIPFLVVAGTFRYTDRYGNSGVFGWDIGLILSKVFVACVRQLNAIFVFI